MSKLFGGELKYKELLLLQRNGDSSHTSYGKFFNCKLIFLSFLTKARVVNSLLLSYFVVYDCMLIWNTIDPISQHSTLMSTHINHYQLQRPLQQAFTIHYKHVFVEN